MSPEIGFVGLGIMGKPMARNLLKAGYPLTAHSRTASSVDELVAEGARQGSSNAGVAQNTEIIITMLPDSADSEEVILGNGGVLEGVREGSVIIDMSSIAPLVSQKIAAEAAKKGVDMLDAPVSGGEPGAVAGTLAIMVGGKEEVFQRCLSILQVMGRSVVRVGDVGRVTPSSWPIRSSWPPTSRPSERPWCWPKRPASTRSWSSTPSGVGWPAAMPSRPRPP